MKELFKFSFMTVVHQKLVFIVMLLLGIVPFIAAQMTNADVEPELMSAARSQALWQICWLVQMLWLLYQSASLVGGHVQSGMAAYFKSRGLSASSQVAVMWGVVMLFALVFTVWTTLATIVFAMPEGELVAKHWVLLSVQQMVLMLLVVSAWVMLTVAISSRFGVVVGYLASLALVLSGFYGVVMVGKVALLQDSPLLDMLYIITPHYYLADLTHRFIHGQGAMPISGFLSVFEYLAGWLLVTAAVAVPLSNVKK